MGIMTEQESAGYMHPRSSHSCGTGHVILGGISPSHPYEILLAIKTNGLGASFPNLP